MDVANLGNAIHSTDALVQAHRLVPTSQWQQYAAERHLHHCGTCQGNQCILVPLLYVSESMYIWSNPAGRNFSHVKTFLHMPHRLMTVVVTKPSSHHCTLILIFIQLSLYVYSFNYFIQLKLTYLCFEILIYILLFILLSFYLLPFKVIVYSC